MDQAEPFRQLEQNFRRHATDENETLKAHYESADDTWRFEGSSVSERIFKALAREGGLHVANDTSQDAWKHWLDGLRRNHIAFVESWSRDESNRSALESEPLPMVLDKLFSTSALVCLEWAAEISSRMRTFDKVRAATSQEPGASGAETDSAHEETNKEIATRSDERWNWAASPLPELESPRDAERQLKEDIREALDLIEEMLNLGQRARAVRVWLMARRIKNLKDTKVALYEQAGQDKAEYYRWERGELPDGSQADRDIRGVLLRIAE